jgi:hypothetical protein
VLTFLGVLISAACVVASGRRLWVAADATGLDPGELSRALRVATANAPKGVWAALGAEVEGEPDADWERDLFEALRAPSAARVALVNEQLAELDYRAQRWVRVPRVCASISSSSGLLLAALSMRAGLMADDIDINAAILAAVNVLAIGFAGTAFCVAAQARAGAMTRQRLVAIDKFLERLEPRSGAQEGPRAGAVGTLGTG